MLDSWAPRGTLRPGVLVEPALGRDWKEEARRRGLEFLLPVYPALRRVWHRDGHLCGGAPFLHLSQTPRPLGLLLRLWARWEPRFRRAGPGSAAPAITFTRSPLSLLPAPRPAHQRVSVRRLEVVGFDTCQELFPTKFSGALPERPRIFLLFLHVRPPTPSQRQTRPEPSPGSSKG